MSATGQLRRKADADDDRGMERPMVSVVVPVRNEGRYLRAGLDALMRQTYPNDRLEVLVIDGRSDDDSRAIAIAAGATSGPARPGEVDGSGGPGRPRLRLLDNPARVTPDAMNIGLREASGDIIVLVGGHCQVADDFIERSVAALESAGADCAGGCIRTEGGTAVARAIARALTSRFGVGPASFRTGGAGWVDTVAFGAYRREVFEKIGTFDTDMVRNQDDEFNYRLTQTGGRIWLDPAIRSVYFSRSTYLGLWRQYFHYGNYKVRLAQKRRGFPSWRNLVPALFVSSIVVLTAGSVRWRPCRRLLGAIGGAYVVGAAGATAATIGEDPVCAALMMPAFAILHVGYGSGFLWGLWHWRATYRVPDGKVGDERQR